MKILVDTGPIVALLAANDAAHQRCVAAASIIPETTLLSTWPCFVEAMYLLGRHNGFRQQKPLWQLRSSGSLELYALDSSDERRMEVLMQQYCDVPMDLADASLMATAEATGLRRLFTLDHDFRIYRLRDGSMLDIFP